MILRIDAAGRIILPKRVRERLRLSAGSTLELEERPEGLILRPNQQSPSMVRRDGLWVHLGKLPDGIRWESLVEDAREERLEDASGL